MIDNRKSSSVGFFLFFSVLLLASILVIVYGTNEKKSLMYSQEYVVTQGQKETIDAKYFEEHGEAFKIGANANGQPVFVDPQVALEALKNDYKTGVNLIKEEFKLAELSDKSYREYLRKGKKVSGGSENAKRQAAFVVEFLEVYDNSFADDFNIKLPY